MLEIGAIATFVVVEAFLELRNIALEVFYDTLDAFIAAIYK